MRLKPTQALSQSSVPHTRWGMGRLQSPHKANTGAPSCWAPAGLTAVLCTHLCLQVLGVHVLVGLVLLGWAARPTAEETAAAAAASEGTTAQHQCLHQGQMHCELAQVPGPSHQSCEPTQTISLPGQQPTKLTRAASPITAASWMADDARLTWNHHLDMRK